MYRFSVDPETANLPEEEKVYIVLADGLNVSGDVDYAVAIEQARKHDGIAKVVILVTTR